MTIKHTGASPLAAELRRTVVDLRKQAGLTQKVVAERMGRTQATISDFERSDGGMTVETLEGYLAAIGGEFTIKIVRKG